MKTGPMNRKRVSIKDVATMAGVSTSTVSHVINDTRYVADETKQRILRVIEELNYRPSFLAQGLKRQTSQTIGLILSDLRGSFFYRFVDTLGSILQEDDYDVLVCNSASSVAKERRHIEMLLRKGIDGLVYAPVDYRTYNEELIRWSVPFVQVERKNANYQADYVGIDDQYEAARVTEFMISRGCRRVAFLMHGETIFSGRRLLGYQSATQEHRCYDADLIERLGLDREQSIEALVQWLTAREPVDGVICTNLRLCRWLLQALQQLGTDYARPRVFSFDDDPWLALLAQPVSALAQPIEEIAARTVETLLGRMRGDESPAKDLRLQCALIDRFPG
jgi:DNA-binding LacI/PurR family transcriptional regulator